MLSRAFRNRFVELHFDELPSQELEVILHQRCSLPLSYAKKLVAIMLDLQVRATVMKIFRLRAAVCKYRELAVKWKFRNSSYSVRKNPLVKRFRKSQSKFLKSFLFRENRQKVKSCPTPYSRRSKTFELDHFQSPREERRFEETSSSLAGK